MPKSSPNFHIPMLTINNWAIQASETYPLPVTLICIPPYHPSSGLLSGLILGFSNSLLHILQTRSHRRDQRHRFKRKQLSPRLIRICKSIYQNITWSLMVCKVKLCLVLATLCRARLSRLPETLGTFPQSSMTGFSRRVRVTQSDFRCKSSES